LKCLLRPTRKSQSTLAKGRKEEFASSEGKNKGGRNPKGGEERKGSKPTYKKEVEFHWLGVDG